MRDGRVIEEGSVWDIIQRQTQQSLKVLCSDPKKLYETVQSSDFITSCVVSGANTVSISVRDITLSSVKENLDVMAQQLGIIIYGIEQANTLEDAYKEIMKNEQ